MRNKAQVKLDPLHHISIIESAGTKCAWVRIRHGGKVFQRSFTFKSHGGKKNAMLAAIETRDREGKKLYGNSWPWTKYSSKNLSSLNSSGEIGVSFSESDNSWVASWQEGAINSRTQRNAYFSVDKFGNQKAKKLAIQKRRSEVKKNEI
jgi:hypothetical protein